MAVNLFFPQSKLDDSTPTTNNNSTAAYGTIDPRRAQLDLAGFLGEVETPKFASELWDMLLDAQNQPRGIPRALIEKKKKEFSLQHTNQQGGSRSNNNGLARGSAAMNPFVMEATRRAEVARKTLAQQRESSPSYAYPPPGVPSLPDSDYDGPVSVSPPPTPTSANRNHHAEKYANKPNDSCSHKKNKKPEEEWDLAVYGNVSNNDYDDKDPRKSEESLKLVDSYRSCDQERKQRHSVRSKKDSSWGGHATAASYSDDDRRRKHRRGSITKYHSRERSGGDIINGRGGIESDLRQNRSSRPNSRSGDEGMGGSVCTVRSRHKSMALCRRSNNSRMDSMCEDNSDKDGHWRYNKRRHLASRSRSRSRSYERKRNGHNHSRHEDNIFSMDDSKRRSLSNKISRNRSPSSLERSRSNIRCKSSSCSRSRSRSNSRCLSRNRNRSERSSERRRSRQYHRRRDDRRTRSSSISRSRSPS